MFNGIRFVPPFVIFCYIFQSELSVFKMLLKGLIKPKLETELHYNLVMGLFLWVVSNVITHEIFSVIAFLKR